ncbi:hypothetical protein [Photobacterium damselae]|uniref:hypothetical protein n=1 Tax=Photobacterium damselae TaxID=38293 RepID=UPI0013024C4F|nr:hypothetical protein [Photobacterium damselae]
MKIVGDSIKFGNVTVSSGKEVFTPTTWFPKSNLLPVTSWAPIYEPDKKTIIFSNGSDSFSQDVSLSALQVKSTGFSKETNSLVTGSICSTDENDGTIATLGGGTGECYSSYLFKSSTNEIVPFRYLKPILNLSGLATNLKGMPPGRYTATYPSHIKYLFKRANGVVSFQYIPMVVSFEIIFDPAQLLDVIPHGDGIITPIYDKSNRLISGETSFNIEVKGVFPSGIKLNFIPSSSKNLFELNNLNDASKIPYYINCDVCDKTNIVNHDGSLVDSSGIYYISSYKSDFDFNLSLGFEDIQASTISSGGFSDTFFIYFEPNL